MKIVTTLLYLFFVSSTVFGQTNKVKGSISTLDTADLTILNIYPDSFPNVSVVFKAETRAGIPVWNLTKEKMRVSENGKNCGIISLEQISKVKPINIGIVIDHSGSMQGDMAQLVDNNGKTLFSYDKYGNLVLPQGYMPPIDDAKSAVKFFVSSFNSEKDFISVIGFSNIVDKKLPLTHDTVAIDAIVDGMKADYSTALYDAMLAGLDEINKADGIRVLVILTDGMDNSSKSNWKEVVDKANKQEIPIYTIGLGDANIDTLRLIAKSSKGEFYFAQSSNSLATIYALISKQIQSYYDLVYSSPNFSSADKTRQVELSFDIDSVYLVTNPGVVTIPAEVETYLEKKEKQKEYFIYGGISVAVLLAAGLLLLYFKRKQDDYPTNANPPTIKNLFPNPTSGNINVEYESSAGQLLIVNSSGQIVKRMPITGSETQFDLSELPNGIYLATIQTDGQQPNAVEFTIQH